MDMYELQVTQDGFHGRRTIPIRGRYWRAWGDTIAVDMDAADVRAMYKAAACGVRDCVCGGYHAARPGPNNPGPYSAGTYLVPREWITDADCDACPAIAVAIG